MLLCWHTTSRVFGSHGLQVWPLRASNSAGFWRYDDPKLGGKTSRQYKLRSQVTKRMSVLYKYLPLERRSFLTDGLLRFSQHSALNDPFECFPALPQAVAEEGLAHIRKELLEPPPHDPYTPREERRKLDRDYLKRARQKLLELPTAAQFRRTFLEKGQANIDAKIGILSLSRRWNSSLMWAHYTSSHTGFCVGFDRKHEFFQQAERQKEGAFICSPVHYSSSRPTIQFRPLVPSDAYAFLLTKSSDWKYEEEERVIALLTLADKTLSASPLPVALFRIPSEAVVEIIVGLRAPMDLITNASNFCALQKIPLYQAAISESAFDFERERI